MLCSALLAYTHSCLAQSRTLNPWSRTSSRYEYLWTSSLGHELTVPEERPQGTIQLGRICFVLLSQGRGVGDPGHSRRELGRERKGIGALLVGPDAVALLRGRPSKAKEQIRRASAVYRIARFPILRSEKQRHAWNAGKEAARKGLEYVQVQGHGPGLLINICAQKAS